MRSRRGAGLEWLSLSYLLYSLVLALGMLLSLPYWLYQILRHGKYRRGFLERVGKVPTRLMTEAGSQAADAVGSWRRQLVQSRDGLSRQHDPSTSHLGSRRFFG